MLEIEFETHYKPFFMPTLRGALTGSKKRYAGINQDGELIFKGLEAARGDWTAFAREFQTRLYKKMFAGKPVEEFIVEQIKTLKSGIFDDKLIYRKRLGQDLEKYNRNVPPHVRAAVEHQLENPAMSFRRGDWVNYVMTLSGPLYVADNQEAALRYDYQHYIDKQLRPIVEAIKGEISLKFEQLVNDQKTLF